ncbi:hypothetical protein [Nocardioides sp. 1609]|uniref:hypothetical protein n=1 Tax=Nocardioides sp. 1609 TaxID=2508327 RepID=UPI00106FB889|nr:hypothetical protein [Nocardioides sp. 1609]
MTDPHQADPHLSYSEVFEILLPRRGQIRIVIADGRPSMEFVTVEGTTQSFVSLEDADVHCGHSRTRETIGAAWDDGHDEATAKYAPALHAVERWHNDNHPGPARFCNLNPCDDIRVATDR